MEAVCGATITLEPTAAKTNTVKQPASFAISIETVPQRKYRQHGLFLRTHILKITDYFSTRQQQTTPGLLQEDPERKLTHPLRLYQYWRLVHLKTGSPILMEPNWQWGAPLLKILTISMRRGN